MQQHPLYRDLVQPVALAVFEVRCGLSLLKHAARAQPDQQLADAVLEDCMALPSRQGQGNRFCLERLFNVSLPTLHDPGSSCTSPSACFRCCLLWGLASLCLVPVKISYLVAIKSLSCCWYVAAAVAVLLPVPHFHGANV